MPRIDSYRRALQNAYLLQLDRRLNPLPPPAAPSALSEDARSQLRGEAVLLRDQIRHAIAKTQDQESRQHLQSAEHRIGAMLDPKK